ncbi:MAG: universal stress protein [Silicimonas sp.]|nr:universal stress protein [Silicimonas sp.]
MFKKIIVGLDGSQQSEVAVRIACDLAKHYESSLTLMHVPHGQTAAFVVGAVAGYRAAASMPSFDEVEAAGKQVLDAGLAIAADAGCTAVKTHMPHGEPAKEILAHADEIGADLIVTGRRGLGGAASLLLGSTSQNISHNAKCACLTVA